MREYKYDVTGRVFTPETMASSPTFGSEFGDQDMTDKAAIIKADEIFDNKLEAAKPGEIVRMQLWQFARLVKPYGPTKKE